jgi:ABC-type Zn uptake system ZnuABC Zn-binding protein ZnuA
MKRLLSAAFAAALLFAGPVFAENRPLRVVATLTIFGDLARSVGGPHVEVKTVVPPKQNPHFIEPKPSDVLRVKRADLFIHAGLDLELWRGPLLDAAGNRDIMPGGRGELDLSQGIALLEVPSHMPSRAEGDIHIHGNPHYYLDPRNALEMTERIRAKLTELDPAHADTFSRNAGALQQRLKERIAAWQEQFRPYERKEIVGYHNEWVYFLDFIGLTASQFLEPKPGIPPTPQQVQFIERYIRDHRIPAIVKAAHEPQQAAVAISKRTGVPVVMLCHNVGELEACGDAVALYDYNVATLAAALGGAR